MCFICRHSKTTEAYPRLTQIISEPIIKNKHMGARASVSFIKDNRESVVLFSHWGGQDFHRTARKYARDLIKDVEHRGDQYPLHRLEPNTVMVDFVRFMSEQEIDMDEHRIISNLYLGRDLYDGDNSDYGHKTISLNH